MKKQSGIIITALCLFALAIAVSLLAGCGPESEPQTTTAENTTVEETEAPPPEKIVYAGGENAYTIIRSDKSSDDITDVALRLKTAIKNKTGVELALKTDLIAPKAGYEDTPYEIVVGETTRPESAAVLPTLLYKDYTVCRKDNKIIILGGSDAATVRAIEYFIGHVLSKEGVYDIDDYYFRAEYPVSSIKLNGREISDYTFVFPTKNGTAISNAIDVLALRIASLTGRRINKSVETAGTFDYEFTFGACSRGPAKDVSIEKTEMVTAASGGSVGLLFDSIFADSAIRSFADKYLPEKSKGEISITIPDGTEKNAVPRIEELAEGADMRMMTSNMLFDETLATRAPLLVSAYTGLLPDVIGIQECNSTGHTNVIAKLKGLYSAVGQTFSNGAAGCCTPIIYLTDKYTEIESGAELFTSRWPKTDSKSYCWVVLERKSDGKRFAFINAHWALILGTYDTEAVFGRKYTNGVEGAQWREDNSAVVIAKMRELRAKYGSDLPCFFTGDMNASITAKSVTMLATDGMKNSFDIAPVRKTGLASYHNNPGQYPGSGNPIDNVFVSADSVTVFKHRIFETDLGISLSDHCPVYIDIKLK